MTKFFLNAMIKFKRQPNQLILLCTAILFISVFYACDKDPDDLGMGILPGDEHVMVKTDTIRLIYANTVKLDSVVSYFPDTAFKVTPRYFTGEYIHPILGKSKSSLLLNFFPDSLNFNFGTGAQADSLVLLVKLDSILGDKSSNLEFNIWELNKSLSYRKIYQSNIDENTYKGATLIGSKSIKYDDTVRIKLSAEMAEKLLKLTPYPDKSANSYFAFQEAFKGLYIEVKGLSNPGALVAVDPWSKSTRTIRRHETRLMLYYKNSTRDTSFNYYPDTRVSKFSHDYAGTPVETALQNNEISQKITYVQGFGGLATRIRIPSLSEWANKYPVSINKAELIIPVEEISEIQNVFYPKRIAIMAVKTTTDNKDQFVSIEYGFGQTFLGGVYDSSIKAYKFNLTKHVQAIVNKKFNGVAVENTDLMLIVDGYKPAQAHTFNFVALNFLPGRGANLNISYSKQ